MDCVSSQPVKFRSVISCSGHLRCGDVQSVGSEVLSES